MSDNNHDSSIDDEWLTSDEVMRYLHLSRMSFYSILKKDDSFPKGYPILTRKKLWKKDDVEDWVKSKSELSES